MDISRAISAHIDAVAVARGYEGTLSLTSYENSTNVAWAAEARVFIVWRDAVWAFAFEQLGAVQMGLRAQPTVEGLVGELPAIKWD